MKRATIQRLLDTPGARVTFDGKLQINGKLASVPSWFKGSLEVGVLLAMPRVGVTMKLDEKDALAFGRFIAPALFDTFQTPATLRKFLGLKEASPGDHVTFIEPDSEGIVREIVGVLRSMPKSNDWQSRFTAGIASSMPDALSNGIAIAGGAGDWAKAIIEAAEAT